ncbi:MULTISPECIES: multidrug effflux MFS transporter [unclassified Chelatococcus]|uniref:multidrug effflux MFS transporter n=1 Tax=unclassified Chelatococcus TaxID=2638111 RepID=UPI001BCBCA38|nr:MULTISPECIES: multidrug effflux MFS transporter [unclassified Chelatococcus]MBS7697388.1 multidrug effflux MFS transporter [Chelatococcus sp. YT9]MBX3560018.1 multidrug effflux MFS transporter [Chelatococcus sp.]
MPSTVSPAGGPRPKFLGNAIILGLLSAIGPFAIDMYLPALPAIGENLRADSNTVQLSIMAFFVALGFGQLFYGPVSDMVGRKPPLYFGITVFAVGSVGCALAPDIVTLIAFRFLQGIGACACSAIPRAIVRDLHRGPDAAKLMSLLMLVFSVSPILAPVIGSVVISIAGWRAVFWIVAVIAALGLVLIGTRLKETRPPAHRVESSIGGAFRAYGALLKDRHFLGLVFIGAFGMSGFFVFLANSSFVLIEHYGLSPTLYSVAFSINAVSFIGVSQFTSMLGRRYGLRNIVRPAVAIYAVLMVLLFVLFALGFDHLAIMVVLLFVANGALGLVIPTSAVLALEDHGALAGTASALMGTLQFATGSVVIAVVGLFVDGSALPMIGGMAACAIASFTFAFVTLRHASSSRAANAAMKAPAE